MKTVFIGGSRDVTRFNPVIEERLHPILDWGLPVLVGDANGAHSLVIFGAGYGWSVLAAASWPHQRDIHYWGTSTPTVLRFSINSAPRFPMSARC